MIFVTVGTHEQPFNRLIKAVDELKRDGVITEDVMMQTGFSTYEPRYCKWSKLISYQDMVKNVENARIVITHGGPASFIMPLQIGKTPIVVPRQHKFEEHINDHQVEFARNVVERMGTIILVEDIEKLGKIITEYDEIVSGMRHEKYCTSKVFVLPSRWESYGISAVEALNCGCYLLLSDSIPPANEMTNNGKYGCVVEAENIDDLTRNIIDMTKREYDQNEINEMVKYAGEEFSWERICKKLLVEMRRVSKKGDI